jgi:RNA polymerase sigma-70 factor (ECF subfamily)
MMPSAPDEEFEAALVAALRKGDDKAFAWMIDAWSPGVLRLARCYVPTQAMAEDVVQEAWLGALRGLDAFEGRSRLRTWVLRIVANIAKSWAEREHRVTPFSSAAFGEGPTVGPERFNSPGDTTPARGGRFLRPGRRCPRGRCSRPKLWTWSARRSPTSRTPSGPS